jgi:hypothetical protein
MEPQSIQYQIRSIPDIYYWIVSGKKMFLGSTFKRPTRTSKDLPIFCKRPISALAANLTELEEPQECTTRTSGRAKLSHSKHRKLGWSRMATFKRR